MLTTKIGRIASTAAILSVALGSLSFAQQALPTRSEDRLSAINAAIKAAGAKWQAGETSISKLSQEDQLRRVGFHFEKLKAEPLNKIKLTATSIPSSVDWRNVNGNDFVTPVKDQGQCGGCWAFSMTGGLEAYTLIQNNTPGQDLSLAEQVLISCSGIGSCDGASGLNGDYIVNTGLPPTSYFPYTAANTACSKAKKGWQDHTYKAAAWGSVDQTVDAIKQAVATYGPVPTAFMVYEDFMNYQGGVYSYTSGKQDGGHAILVVGYNDDGQYFIVKNSWGTGWGEDGFFRIAYSQVTDSNVQFGMSAIAYQGGANSSSSSDNNNYYQTQLNSSKFNTDDANKRIEPVVNQAGL
jgi:C1A family cysteine protease